MRLDDDFVELEDQQVPDTPEMRHHLKQIASGHCADFRRSFAGLEVAKELVARGQPHWFLDLLSLWRPAGEPSGEHGLRLAVRDGYLNFYRLGQSVARVSAVRGQLRGRVHVKYFSEACSQAYGHFGPSEVAWQEHRAPYEGVSTLQKWCGVIAERYAGREKELVDQLVAQNPNVIDLEMALPAWGSRRNAPRMDIVTIEAGQVVFWEVKTAGDSRVRCRDEGDQVKLPHVVDQLQQYRDFLEQDTHCIRIAEAYQNAARVFVQLQELADRLGPTRTLAPEIIAASRGAPLTVAREAALVVLDEAAPEGARWRSWHENGHAKKLKGRVRVVAQSKPGRLLLGDAV